MKRLISLLMILTVVLAAFVSCGDKAPVEKDYSLAIGVALTEKLENNKLKQEAQEYKIKIIYLCSSIIMIVVIAIFVSVIAILIRIFAGPCVSGFRI